MNEAAILPIAGLYLLKHGTRWRFSGTDVLVFGFAFMMACTEYSAKNYSEAQNLMFDVLGTIVLPYILAKGIIEPWGLREAFAKRTVVLLAVVAMLSTFEFRMGRNLFRMWLDRFFPGQGSWVTTFRYGFARAAGPYGHAILAGMVFMFGYRIQRWLQWTGAWRNTRWPLPMKPGLFFTLVLLGGIAISLARGPQLGALVSGIILFTARAKSRRAMVSAALVLLVVTGVPGYFAFQSYVSVGRAGAKTLSQETAAYRKELIEKYTEVALRRPVFGWGRGAWPKVPGLESTDNHYLLLALNHGVVTLGLFVGIVVWAGFRLAAYGSRRPRSDPSALLAFTLLAIYFGYAVALATVYQGMQTMQIFFLVTGWAEGLLLQRRPVAAPAHQAAAPLRTPPFAFTRVLT
jgi:hypothetical protein